MTWVSHHRVHLKTRFICSAVFMVSIIICDNSANEVLNAIWLESRQTSARGMYEQNGYSYKTHIARMEMIVFVYPKHHNINQFFFCTLAGSMCPLCGCESGVCCLLTSQSAVNQNCIWLKYKPVFCHPLAGCVCVCLSVIVSLSVLWSLYICFLLLFSMAFDFIRWLVSCFRFNNSVNAQSCNPIQCLCK